MLVLFETAAGYAVFKLLDEKKLQKTENLYLDFESPDAASKVVKLKHFKKFEDTTEALAAATAAIEGKMSKSLRRLMKKVIAKEAHEELAVADAKLGNVIKDKFNINCVSNSAIQELMRGIRNQMNSLITGLPEKEMAAMALGLAHSLSRYKLKFSPDKVDTMIVQAISLLDDLDKELNNYSMRAREWYGWHFPELGKIITDNLVFAKVVHFMGFRTNAATTDFSEILPEELEHEVKEVAEISMGTEISDEDMLNIKYLCEQVTEITEYRAQLYDYIKNRMTAIAPNLTVLVGELVGARLIAHAGSLLNLAKHPASTVQILGAEKALFRALKTKHDTPKYGLIYHASLVGQSTAKNKGKTSRMLAAKAALAIRVDALGEETNATMGMENRAKLVSRIKMLEDQNMVILINDTDDEPIAWVIRTVLTVRSVVELKKLVEGVGNGSDLVTAAGFVTIITWCPVTLPTMLQSFTNLKSRRISGSGKAMAKWEKYENKSLVKTYDTSADSTLPSVPKKRKFEEDEVENEVVTKKIKLERTVDEEAVDEDTQGEVKKKRKKKNKHANDSASLDTTQDSIGTPDVGSEKKKKKKKKKIKEEPESD